MLRYIVKRVTFACTLSFAVLTAAFFLGRMTPANVMTATDPQGYHLVSPLTDRDPFHFEKPILEQYRLYLLELVKNRSIFSRSYLNDKKSFFQDLNTNNALLYTFVLAAFFLTFALPLSYLFAVYSFAYRNSRRNAWVYFIITYLYFLMPRLIPMYLREIFQTRVGICDGNGISDVRFVDFRHWNLPVMFGAIAITCRLFRLLRDRYEGVATSDYIRTARAKGIPEDQIVLHHATLPVLLPFLDLLAPSLSHLFLGTVWLEPEFSLPGIGTRGRSAAAMRDHNFLLPLTLYIFMVQQLMRLAMDLIRMRLDPHVKQRLLRGERSVRRA